MEKHVIQTRDLVHKVDIEHRVCLNNNRLVEINPIGHETCATNFQVDKRSPELVKRLNYVSICGFTSHVDTSLAKALDPGIVSKEWLMASLAAIVKIVSIEVLEPWDCGGYKVWMAQAMIAKSSWWLVDQHRDYIFLDVVKPTTQCHGPARMSGYKYGREDE